MSLSHNPGQVRTLHGIVAVPLLQHLLALVDEGSLEGTGAQDVVRGSAILAQVPHSAPQDATNGNVQISCAVNIAGTG